MVSLNNYAPLKAYTVPDLQLLGPEATLLRGPIFMGHEKLLKFDFTILY